MSLIESVFRYIVEGHVAIGKMTTGQDVNRREALNAAAVALFDLTAFQAVTSCAPGQEQVAAATQQQTGGDAIQPVEGTAVPEPTQQPVEPTSVPIPKGIKENTPVVGNPTVNPPEYKLDF